MKTRNMDMETEGTQNMKLWIKIKGFFALLLLFLCMAIPMRAYAADGRMIIAISQSDVAVGDTVTVTLSSQGPNGEKASANMEFTYNSNVFSFVSCNASNYNGNESGKVTATGSSVQVVLKAVSPGSSKLLLNGSNGVVQDTQEALGDMSAAGASLSASGQSGGTGAGVDTQPGDTSGEGTGTTPETPGEGDGAGTTPELPGEGAGAGTGPGTSGELPGDGTEPGGSGELPGDGTEPGGSGGTETGQGYQEEFEYLQEQYKELENRYREEKSFARKTIAIMAFAILVLLILIVNLLIARKRMSDEEDDFEEEVEYKRKPKGKRFHRGTFLSQEEDDWLDDEDDWLDDEDDLPTEKEPENSDRVKKKEEIEFIDLDDF